MAKLRHEPAKAKQSLERLGISETVGSLAMAGILALKTEEILPTVAIYAAKGG